MIFFSFTLFLLRPQQPSCGGAKFIFGLSVAQEFFVARKTEPPVVLVKWYDMTKWLLERVDSFPKNQRFIFGQRVADHVLTKCRKSKKQS